MADTQERDLLPAPPESEIASAEREIFRVVASEPPGYFSFSYDRLLAYLCEVNHTAPAAQHAIRRSIEAGRLRESIHYETHYENGASILDPPSRIQIKDLSVTDQFWTDYYKQSANGEQSGESASTSPMKITTDQSSHIENDHGGDKSPGPDAVSANQSKIFPRGIKGIAQDLIDFIYYLDSHRRPKLSDNEIARGFATEFKGGSATSDDEARKLLARYRKLRGETRVAI